jgi:hypothetical protein
MIYLVLYRIHTLQVNVINWFGDSRVLANLSLSQYMNGWCIWELLILSIQSGKTLKFLSRLKFSCGLLIRKNFSLKINSSKEDGRICILVAFVLRLKQRTICFCNAHCEAEFSFGWRSIRISLCIGLLWMMFYSILVLFLIRKHVLLVQSFVLCVKLYF